MLRRVPHGSIAYDITVALRDAVLRKPLGMVFTDEQLAAEFDEEILAWFEGGEAIATLQMKAVSPTEWKMRQVAVAPQRQGQGVGKRLVRFSEDWARRAGVRSIVLHARTTAVPFYERLGYHTQGPSFQEVHIPHLKMAKDLSLGTSNGESGLAIVPWGASEGDRLSLANRVAKGFGERLGPRSGGVCLSFQELHPESDFPAILKNLQSQNFKAALWITGEAETSLVAHVLNGLGNGAGVACLVGSPLDVLGSSPFADRGRWTAGCADMLFGEPNEGDSPISPLEAWEAMDGAWDVWRDLAGSLVGDGNQATAFQSLQVARYGSSHSS